jgi:hypothetical protein
LGADLGLSGARVIRRLGWPAGVAGQHRGMGVSIRAPIARDLPTITWGARGDVREIDLNLGGLLVEIDAQGRIPGEIELRKQPFVGPERREVELGDPAFDAVVCARGPTLLLTALLNHTTRPQVFDLISRGGRVVGGALRLPIPYSGGKLETLRPLVATLMGLAEPLRRPEDFVERVCAVARQDPQPNVRQHALALLTARVGDDPRVRELCRALLAEAHEGLRLQAATFLGDEGREALLAIARNCPGDNPNAVRAIRALGRRLTSDEVAAILNRAAPAGWQATARAAIDTLALIADARALEHLSLLVRQPESDLAAMAAQAFGRTGTPAAERSLVATLDDARPDVRLAAAEALGQIGSAAAVAPLRLLDETGPRSLRSAARAAIAQIQTRLPGATPGQLSMAPGEGGQLSIADDQAGRLSLTRVGRSG